MYLGIIVNEKYHHDYCNVTIDILRHRPSSDIYNTPTLVPSLYSADSNRDASAFLTSI